MTETCGNCRFWDEHGQRSHGRRFKGTTQIWHMPCRRHAAYVPRMFDDWCGDWQAKDAPLDDRILTPTPVAVSETPVGKRQSADERIGQGWSKEDFVDRRAAEDPYGPPIPHDGGRCPHCGC